MPTYSSLSTTAANSEAWLAAMPSNPSIEVNIFGTLARFRNADGSWTVFHGDLGGLSISNGQLQGTVRWVTHCTGSGGFETMAEVETFGGVFDHINFSASAFMAGSIDTRAQILFNRSGLVFNGDGLNNVFTNGIGANTFNGGDGLDTVSYAHAAGSISLSLGTGIPRSSWLAGHVFNSIEGIIGTKFGDTIGGDDGRNVLSGGGGDDSLFGGGGNDSLFGGEGNDWLDTGYMGVGGDFVDGGAGTDTLAFGQITYGGMFIMLNGAGIGVASVIQSSQDTQSFRDIEIIRGTNQGDRFRGSDADDTFLGFGGDDTFNGFNGDDRLYGGDGNDTINGDAGNDTLWGDGGADTLYGGYGNDTIHGDGQNDTVAYDQTYVIGMPQIYNVVVTLNDGVASTATSVNGGIDTLYGISHVIGSTGWDTIIGNSGNNRLDGNWGDDRILGRHGDDTVLGGGGNDVLYGDDDWYYQGGSAAYGSDSVNGGEGNDLIVAGLGDDSIAGGAGNDTLDYSAIISENGDGIYYVVASLASGVAQKYYFSYYDGVAFGVGTDTIRGGSLGIERLIGTTEGDWLQGSNLSETLMGGYGSDVLLGLNGNDWLDGGQEGDSMAGGNGNDTYVVDSTLDTVTETRAGGIDTLITWIDGTVLRGNIENLTLTGTARTGTGSSADNTLIGNAQDNTLTGLAGNDTLWGDSGADRLDGGAGADRMWGGAGADVFVISRAAFSPAGAGDSIGDVEAADRIDLTGIDADTTRNGNQAFSWVLPDWTAAFGGVAGQLRVSYNVGTYTVQGDTDGDRVADVEFTVHMTPVNTWLTGDHFLL